jgi:hypothetical protein
MSNKAPNLAALAVSVIDPIETKNRFSLETAE